jgi:hypothetical protein
MVEPDYRDCLRDSADLRAALHSAASLFHMHDWVFKTNEPAVRKRFTFTDRTKTVIPVYDSGTFANALEQDYPDFGRVRGIANATKHLELIGKNIRPVPNAPSHAADTSVKIAGGGGGAYGAGTAGWGVGRWGYASKPRVVLAGPPDMKFSDIATAVYNMWETLRSAHQWW